MRTWRPMLAAIAVTFLVLVTLVIGGLHPQAVRTAAADAPNQFTIAVLRPGHRVCEGPLVSHGPARSVGVWGAPTGGTARLTITVRNARTGAMLASGPMEAQPVEAEWTSHLAQAVPDGRRLRVCLTDNTNVFSLAGSPASAPHLVATGGSKGQRFSLVLLSDANNSLLNSLPTAFARASLWRPSWVGSWTFWVLTILLLATFGIGLAGVASAASADGGPDGLTAPLPTGHGAARRPGGSEPSENRPQPVR
jgi:hypothetical protein